MNFVYSSFRLLEFFSGISLNRCSVVEKRTYIKLQDFETEAQCAKIETAVFHLCNRERKRELKV